MPFQVPSTTSTSKNSPNAIVSACASAKPEGRSISRQTTVVMSLPESQEVESEECSLQSKPPNYYELDSIKEGLVRPARIQERDANGLEPMDGLISVLSAIYAKLIVITGLCFPMAEVISHRIPINWYEGFYLFLYLGSIFFLLVIYVSQRLTTQSLGSMLHLKSILCWIHSDRRSESSETNDGTASSTYSDISSPGPAHFGSFYLRLGAVAFGIGSMIYTGLEFGQYFELESKEHCYSFLYGFTPSAHMTFTFFQLYFIFMNTKNFITRHIYIARFGLMHMIATNLCVWLHVLIQETKHQIMMIIHPSLSNPTDMLTVNETDRRPKRSVDDHEMFTTTHGQCRRSNVIGQLVKDASQFLFPCTIEYSLICAAILYVMWKHTNRENATGNHRSRHRSTGSATTVYHHQKHYYQVDCAKAHKGLFCGIFLLVVCIISLILFFVLIKKPNYKELGVLQAHIVELAIYTICAFACIIAIYKVKQLKYNHLHNIELDNILLIVAQTGLYVFNMFSVIGAFFTKKDTNTQLVLLNAFVCIVQATLQSVFILDATRRFASTVKQVRNKPGREAVTFLLVCNFAMWAINTLETRRADSNPVQMNFYGFWAWTIITHVTTPLTIFFRFHSTVCLCDIWKRTYKLKMNDSF